MVSISFFLILIPLSLVRSDRLPDDHYIRGEPIEERDDPSRVEDGDFDCQHSPDHRACWGGGFSIATDFDRIWPETGNTRHYDLEIVNTTCNPDGYGDRMCLLINHQFPGPTLYADWGDILSISVTNKLPDNGTSLHWHGIRQLNSCSSDGTNGLTECPLAPGKTRRYEFRCTQHGTAWYHSHHSTQYGDGVLGTIIINGPAQQNYDIDLGTYTLGDWYHQTAFQIEWLSTSFGEKGTAPPSSDTLLINGTNKLDNGRGSYGLVTLQQGRRYRLRFVNTSVDSIIRISLDGHPFSVITADLVPIHAFTAKWLLMGSGQRYDVVIEANQTAANYWFRCEIAESCGSRTHNSAKSIFRYEGAGQDEPKSQASPKDTEDCVEQTGLTPWVPNSVPRGLFLNQAESLAIDFGVGESAVRTNGENVVYWGVNMSAIDIDWETPTLSYVKRGVTDYPTSYNLIHVAHQSTWVFWIVQEIEGSLASVPHPMHLHGHDFYILGTGSGTFDKASHLKDLVFENPTRRDVAMLPASGWMVIAFPADNPGGWLFHCHIAWHVSQGLGVQFLESPDEIQGLDDDAMDTGCDEWTDYLQNGNPAYRKFDSGL